jgi:hypothetical protein
MTANRRAGSLKIATLVSLALGITLSGCSIAPEKAQVTDAPSVSATASATPSATATPDPAVPTETVESPTPEIPDVPAVPVTPVAPEVTPAPTVIQEIPSPHTIALKTFTFPDGHISFNYPADWSVQLDESNGVSATVFDETGKKVAFTFSNNLGGAISGPVTRTLFDSEMMPTFPSDKGGQAAFAFSYEAYPDASGSRYYMAVVPEIFLKEGESGSATSFLIAPNGGAGAYVDFADIHFASAAEAKAWMETPQYKRLKSLLTSFRYA